MSLRGIYDGGGLRKQNGHYQSSTKRGPINPDGTLLETHIIYEIFEGEEQFLEPYIFNHDEDDPNKQITLDAGERIRYRFKCVHNETYRYSPTIETSIYRWSGFLENFYIGRPGDFYLDLGVRYVKAAWSIYPDRYHPPGWIDVISASRDSNYQFQTGIWAGFLGWIAGGAELNYYDDTVTSQYGYGKLYLWEVQDTTTEAIDTVGIRYLGISAEVTSGYNERDLVAGKVLFQGTGTSGGTVVPLTTDDHCLTGKFDIIICNESGSSKTLEIAPVKFNQQELVPLPGTNSISNAEGNSTYLQIYEKRL